MNSHKLDRIEKLLSQAAGAPRPVMRIILSDEWFFGDNPNQPVPAISADGMTERYPASQAPPRLPGEVWIGLPDDWGKIPSE